MMMVRQELQQALNERSLEESSEEGGQGQKPEKLILHRRRLQEKTIADKRGGECSQPWKFLEA